MSDLSLRALNRTLLARQFLDQRTERSALEVIEHLLAMQGQEPNWPYVGLWTRVAGFGHDDLTTLLEERRVVRGPSLRVTQHLVSADDYLWLRPSLQPVLDRNLRHSYFAEQTEGLDPAELIDAAREALGDGTLPRRQLSKLLGERFPGRAGGVLAPTVELHIPVVHPPPAGVWGGWWSRPVHVALAESWIGKPMDRPDVAQLITRYLAAYGPATAQDIQRWSGLPAPLVRQDLDRLRPSLRVLRDERGRELLDLPGAPLADPDTPVPVRFLPGFENLLLGHDDRSRVVREEDRKLVAPGYSMVKPTYLVDGFVHGSWTLEGTKLAITPFRPLSKAERVAVLEEAELLYPFVVPGGAAIDIAVTDSGG